MKLSLIVEADIRSFDILSKSKKSLQKEPIHKLLGFNRPLTKVAEGSFATLYEHPNSSDILIKVTTHEEDVINAARAQRIRSDNIVKLYHWPDKKLIKPLPAINAWAILVEKIMGTPMRYSTGHFYKLCYNGNFDLAKDWLNAGGSPEQINILKLYNLDDDLEMSKLSLLFEALNELVRYNIDLSDFDQNILDDGKRYVIIDLGF